MKRPGDLFDIEYYQSIEGQQLPPNRRGKPQQPCSRVRCGRWDRYKCQCMIWPGVTMCPMLPEQIDAYRAQPVPKDGHISVTLDFIPVTERLPENPREVFAFVDGSLRRCHYLESGRGMEWKICGKATYFSKGLVTHWAEIPAIKEVKP